MPEPFIGQIQLLGCRFAPAQWALCLGQLLPITQNTSLFSLIGSAYGGNGTTRFALPDFAGVAACGQGQGPGLTPRGRGDQFGEAAVTLGADQQPAHTHAMTIFGTDHSDVSETPRGGLGNIETNFAFVPGPGDTPFASQMIWPQGGGQAHENRQPLLALNYSIALQGIFPTYR